MLYVYLLMALTQCPCLGRVQGTPNHLCKLMHIHCAYRLLDSVFCSFPAAIPDFSGRCFANLLPETVFVIGFSPGDYKEGNGVALRADRLEFPSLCPGRFGRYSSC